MKDPNVCPQNLNLCYFGVFSWQPPGRDANYLVTLGPMYLYNISIQPYTALIRYFKGTLIFFKTLMWIGRDVFAISWQGFRHDNAKYGGY